MLSELHSCLEALIRTRGLIDARDVDVQFEPPAKAWVGSRIRPTLSLFLFDVQENTDLRQTAPVTSRGNGRGVHRVPPRRFDLRYMVSAVSSVVADEHLILWRTLATLLKHPVLPDELVPPALKAWDIPVTGRVSKPEESPRPLDIWSALESPPRPSLVYVLTVALDLEIEISAPLVLTRITRYTGVAAPVGAAAEQVVQIGGLVCTRTGAPVPGARVLVRGRSGLEATTNEAGEFALAGLRTGPLQLQVVVGGRDPRDVAVDIPSDRYEIVLD